MNKHLTTAFRYGTLKSHPSSGSWMRSLLMGVCCLSAFGYAATIPAGMDARVLSAQPGGLFAGTTDTYFKHLQVYRSLDTGRTWSPISQGLPNVAVSAFGNNPSFHFLSAGNTVYRSADKGNTWVATTPIVGGKYSTVIASLNVSGPTLLVGTERTGLFRSIDNGDHWAPANKGLDATSSISGLVSQGTLRFAVTSDGQVFKSADTGSSWSKVHDAFGDRAEAKLAVDGDVLLVGTLSDGVFRSLDHGLTWENASAGLTNLFDLYVRDICANNGQLFLANRSGIFRSTDHGKTWAFFHGFEDCGAQKDETLALAIVDTFLFRSTWSGIVKIPFSKTGAVAQKLSTSVGQNAFRALAANPAGPIPAGHFPDIVSVQRGLVFVSANNFSVDQFFVYKSLDTARTWSEVAIGLPDSPITAFGSNSNFIFFATSTSVYRSPDNGNTWFPTASIAHACQAVTITSLQVSGSTILVGTASDGVFRSVDNGDHWAIVGVGQMNGTTAIASQGTLHYAVVGQQTLFVSPDTGATWSRLTTNLLTKGIESFAIDRNVLLAGTNYEGFYRSLDKGTTWDLCNVANPANSEFIKHIAVDQGNIFFESNNGIHRSVDQGKTWTTIKLKAGDDGRSYSLAVVDTSLLRVSSDGVTVLPFPRAKGSSSLVPKEATQNLGQSAVFTVLGSQVNYSLDRAGIVKMGVFTVGGQFLQTLVDGYQVSGQHQVELTGAPLPTGVYLLQIHMGEVNRSVRVVLNR